MYLNWNWFRNGSDLVYEDFQLKTSSQSAEGLDLSWFLRMANSCAVLAQSGLRTLMRAGKCNSSICLKLLPIVCPAIRVWYVSRPNTLKSWISEKIIVAFLRSRAFHAHFSRAGIMGIWRGIEFFIWRYPHWVKSEANIPKRLGILRAPICLVSF